jgi:hypothetical protein
MIDGGFGPRFTLDALLMQGVFHGRNTFAKHLTRKLKWLLTLDVSI